VDPAAEARHRNHRNAQRQGQEAARVDLPYRHILLMRIKAKDYILRPARRSPYVMVTTTSSIDEVDKSDTTTILMTGATMFPKTPG